jgi:hypothetical protein
VSQANLGILTRRARLPSTCILLILIAIAGALPSAALAARPSVPAVFTGTALWVREVSSTENGLGLAQVAAGAGVRTLYVKAADGASPEPQFSTALVSEIRSTGTTVCAWTFMYGSDPTAEAAVAASAAGDGAQCLVIDAEGTADVPNLYDAAQVFVRTLRAQVGAKFPIGLASQAEITEHPTFPYSVFLGPGAFNVVLPLIYWLDFGQSVKEAYAETMAANAIYGRPILPVGQLYGTPPPPELERFRSLAAAYGTAGLSFFDLDAAQPQQLAALNTPLPKLPRRALTAPTVRPGADGDQIVQAQELLNAAGAHLPVGGYYGAQTAHATASFQARHHLTPNGILNPATWKALLHFTPREPSWANAPPNSAR